VVGVVLGGLLWLGGCKKAEEPGKSAVSKPSLNVLLITLDTTRADALSCYGHPVVKTPALDKLAAEGALFAQCTSCVPITLPSHASILTGTYPFIHGTRLNSRPFADEGNVTLSEILKQAGYVTGAEVSAFVLNAMWGIDQGFDTFGDVGMRPTPGEAVRDEPAGWGLVNSEPADRMCERAIGWLEEHASAPFFLWVHFFDPHFPYEPPEPFKSQYENPYLGEVAFMDQQVGRLLDRLKALGLEGKTLVAVVGDHGEAFTQHREGTHSYFVYDSTLEVPLIFRCPGKIPAGRRIPAQVRTVDVVPTILDLLGMGPKPDAQGVSLLPLMSGSEADLDLAAYGETMSPHLELGYAQLRCLRAGGWKYIHAPTPELYNLVDDPGESVNVAEQHPDIVAALRERLRELIAEPSSVASEGPTEQPLDQVTVERLASLGYLARATGDDVGDELQGFAELKGADPKTRIGQHIKFMMARAHLAEGAPEKAVELLESLVQEEPDNPGAFALLAQLYRRAGRLTEAVEAYQRVLALRPDDAVIRLDAGRLLGELGRIDDAVEQLRQVAQEMPKYPDAHAYLALALAKQGQWAAAIEGFERALALDPGHEEARVGLSGVFEARRQPRDAAQVLREGLRLRPDCVKLANNLAWLLATASDRELRDGAEAVRLAEGIVERRGDDDPAILDTLAAAYAEAGRFADAVRTARRAVELASSADQPDLSAEIAERLKNYEAHQPYTQSE
jgi:choline-sulfatase